MDKGIDPISSPDLIALPDNSDVMSSQLLELLPSDLSNSKSTSIRTPEADSSVYIDNMFNDLHLNF